MPYQTPLQDSFSAFSSCSVSVPDSDADRRSPSVPFSLYTVHSPPFVHPSLIFTFIDCFADHTENLTGNLKKTFYPVHSQIFSFPETKKEKQSVTTTSLFHYDNISFKLFTFPIISKSILFHTAITRILELAPFFINIFLYLFSKPLVTLNIHFAEIFLNAFVPTFEADSSPL